MKTVLISSFGPFTMLSSRMRPSSMKMFVYHNVTMRSIVQVNNSFRTRSSYCVTSSIEPSKSNKQISESLLHPSSVHHHCCEKYKHNKYVENSISVKTRTKKNDTLFFGSNYNYSLTSLIPNNVQCSRHYSTLKPAATAELFLPEFPTIQGTEALIAGIHNVTGLPWWSTVIVSALLLRVLLPLPLSIYSMHNHVRLQRLQPEIKEIAKGVKKEVALAMQKQMWTEQRAKRVFIKNMKIQLRNLYIRDNCHPMKDAASFWVRVPIWVSASIALRNMSARANNPLLENHETCQSMSVEGMAWFADLTVVDSTWILPVMMGAVSLLNVEINRRSMSEMTTYRRYLTYGFRGLSLVFIPICANLPSGLVLYWVSSGLFTTMQNLLVDRSETFHRLVGIKPLSETNQEAPEKAKSSAKS